MTTTEKTYVATMVAFMCSASQSPSGSKFFSDTCRELGVSSQDVLNCTSRGPAFKETIYSALRSMSSNDKKQAQQYFIKAALADGSGLAAFIMNEICEECNMFDHIE
ncbi:MAG: hypothetical protein IJK41_08865 [Muribaculaceae bacterium]|nr:hypothetical protein [Muribaculaceae bacterium]